MHHHLSKYIYNYSTLSKHILYLIVKTESEKVLIIKIIAEEIHYVEH